MTAKNSLAEQVLGVSRLDENNAIHTAYTHVTGVTLPGQEFIDECARLDSYNIYEWDTIPPADQESITTLYLLRQIFGDKPPGLRRLCTPLLQWPFYEAAYNRLDTVPDSPRPRWALQAGCFTPIASAAFSALSQEVYCARPITLDLTTSRGRVRQGDYFITDAVKILGIASDSIHVAQTNCLIHSLKTPGLDATAQASNLFGELCRVLQPGGSLLMYEEASQLDKAEYPEYESEKSQARVAEFKEEIRTSLIRAGFASIVMAQATEIEGVDFLFDPDRDFARYKFYERPATVTISATKPPLATST